MLFTDYLTPSSLIVELISQNYGWCQVLLLIIYHNCAALTRLNHFSDRCLVFLEKDGNALCRGR